MARPKKHPFDRKDCMMMIRCTAAQRALWRGAAKFYGKTPAEWIREVLDEASVIRKWERKK